MDYHAFVRELAVLKERRDQYRDALSSHGTAAPAGTDAQGTANASLSLTLGKAGPLRERTSITVAEEVKAWATKLPDEQKRLIYPVRRALKGEDAAVPSLEEIGSASGAAVQREMAYRPPDEGRPSQAFEGQKGKAGGSPAGPHGGSGAAGDGGSGGRGSRLALWLPTLILGVYLGYTVLRWQDLTGGGQRYPWGN